MPLSPPPPMNAPTPLETLDLPPEIVEYKWLHILYDAVQSEMNRISQRVTSRVNIISERYQFTLDHHVQSLTVIEASVNMNLNKMSFAW